MKKIYLILIMLFTIGMTNMYGQCTSYDYELSKTGFGCDYSVGTFCFVANGNWTEGDECNQYVVDIKYPTGSITIVDIGGYEFLSEDDDYTTIRGYVNLTDDASDYVCFDGIVNMPGTQLKLFVVHPETGDVVNPGGDVFYLDDQLVIGSDGAETLVSQAIGDGLLEIDGNSQNVTIHGILVVDEDYSFNSFSTLLMSSGSSVRVESGFTFNTTNTKFYTCSGEEWEGIDVEPNATMEFVRSEINNASIAINLKNESDCYVFGGKFYNNDIGIKVGGESHSSLNIEGSPYGGQTEFTDGDIGISYADLGFHSLNGYVTFNNLGTGIQNLSFSLNVNDILFNSCSRAIVSDLYSEEWPYDISITNCNFNNTDYNAITVTGALLCNIKDNVINGGGIGIKRVSEMTDEVTYIEDNNISGAIRGIVADVMQSIGYIQGNSIVSYLTAIEVNGLAGDNNWYTQHNDQIETSSTSLPFLTTVYYNNVVGGNIYKNSNIKAAFGGVKVNGGYFNQIGYNDVNLGYGGLPTSLSPFGVSLSSCDMSNIYSNSAIGFGAGVSILGDNSGSEVRENDMSAMNVKLEYGNIIQSFAHTGLQPYKKNHFGPSTSDAPKAINYSPYLIAVGNEYKLSSTAGNKGTDLFPYFVSEYNKWFNKVNGGTGGNGNQNPIDKYKEVIEEDTSLVKKVKKHYGTGGVLHDVIITTVRHILDYRELGGEMFEDVLQDPDYQENVEVVTLENQLNNVLSAAIYTEQEVNNWSDDMNNVISAINQFKTFTYDPITNSIQVHTNDPKYKELLNHLSNIKSVYSGSILSKQTTVNTAVGDLLVQCNALSRTGSEFSNYKRDILSMMMKYQISNFSGFNENEKNVINNISEECGYLYGEAVYMARSLRSTYDLNTPIYSDDCEDSKESIELRNINNPKELTIYPNPAKDVIVITNKGNTVFEIVNSTGRLMNEVKVKGNMEVNISNYPEGIYFLVDKSSKIKTMKFTVIK